MVTSDAVPFEARGVSKRFGQVRALDDVTLTLRAGEVMALMGENGAGKSTLLKILAGDHQPDDGELIMGAEAVRFAHPAAARRMGMSVIAQEPEIVSHVSVAENIYIGALDGVPFNQSSLVAKARAEIHRWGFDSVLSPEALGGSLSPAQRQVVEIIRAVVSEPRVICFDEPTSSLGDDEVELLFNLIRTLRDDGVAIGYVSHRMHEIFELADQITVLRDGGFVGVEQVSDTDAGTLVRMMVGRDLSGYFDRTAATPGQTILELDSVSNEYVSDISLTVREGEVVGIAGLVGAGRSELLKTIVGDYRVVDGRMRIHGEQVDFTSPAGALAAGIGFAPEERKAEALVLERSIRDNIALTVLRKLARWGFVSDRRESALADRYIERLNVRTPSSSQLVKRLSGGNQQKVVLARWLAADPILLLLDEPTRGIDVGAKSEIYSIIDELAHQGVAILMVSSELPEVIGISDRIYVMAEGRFVGEVPAGEATEESILHLAINSPASTAA